MNELHLLFRRGPLHCLPPYREHNRLSRLGKRQDYQIVAFRHVIKQTAIEEQRKCSPFFRFE